MAGGPTPAEQYGLLIKRDGSNQSRGGTAQLRVSPSLEKYKQIARNMKFNLIPGGASSPIKELQMRMKESSDSLKY